MGHTDAKPRQATDLPGSREPNRIAVVSGAANGLGAAIARRLSADGYAVTGIDLDFADGQDHGLSAAVECDVSDLDAVRENFGHLDVVDVLVNCAGIFPRKPFEEITPAEWHRVIGVNLGGPWNLTQATLPALRRSGAASVVNVTSGTTSKGAAGQAHYVASKAGVEGLTRSLARELGPEGIRVNAVSPGLIRTDTAAEIFTDAEFEINQQTRCIPEPLSVDDLVGTVAYLCGPDSRMMTGQVLAVDGGSTMR